jgi:hypothetical protein
MGTTTTDPKQIFACDTYGESIVPGDVVRYNSRLYTVVGMEHEVSGDGYYDETVYLEMMDSRSKKPIFVEDNEVELV